MSSQVTAHMELMEDEMVLPTRKSKLLHYSISCYNIIGSVKVTDDIVSRG